MPNTFTPDLELASSLALKDPRTAISIADAHLKNDPYSTNALFVKYHAFSSLGDWQSALNVANQHTKLLPDKASSHLKRADMLYHLEQHHEAIAATQTAIVLDHKKILGSEPYRLAALCYAALGNRTKAVAVTSQIPELENNQWFPPIGAIPAGTKKQYAVVVANIAYHVASNKNYVLPKRKILSEA